MKVNVKQLLIDMINIPSLSRHEHKLALYLSGYMNDNGFSARLDEAGNVVGVRGPADALNKVVLLGHMDTVPGDIPVKLDGDLLYGRGSVDAKGPLATFIAAAAQIDIPKDTSIIVAGAVEEEAATSKGARFIAREISPDYCIIGEPSGSDGVTIGYKGRILARALMQQDNAHSAGAGRSIAENAIDWWHHVEEIADNFNGDKTGLFQSILPGLRSIKTENNGLQETAEMNLGFRLPPNFDVDKFRETLIGISPDANLDFRGYEPAWSGERNSVLVRSFTSAIRSEGFRPKLKYKTGTSDMNVVGPVWQCPILAYGPGDSNLDHRPDEHISLKELEKSVEILHAAMRKLFAHPDF